jgi:hypothetical protein
MVATTITLTTWSRRIGTVHHALQTLAKQRPAADRIVLWLAAGEAGIPPQGRTDLLPAPLRETLARWPLMQVRWFPGNIRSHKKMIPALLDPELRTHRLVTADDDILYPQGWLADLLQMHARHPRAVIAHRARVVRYPKPYRTWSVRGKHASTMHGPLLMPTTGAGALYPPGSLHPAATDHALAMRLAPTADDLFTWIHTVLQRTPVVLTQHPRTSIASVPGGGSGPLSAINNGQGQNDRQVRRLIEHYRHHPEIARRGWTKSRPATKRTAAPARPAAKRTAAPARPAIRRTAAPARPAAKRTAVPARPAIRRTAVPARPAALLALRRLPALRRLMVLRRSRR